MTIWPPEHVRLRRERELGARAQQLPHRYPSKAPHAMYNRRRGLNSDCGKARRRGDLADAASGMGRLLREVAVANPPPKGLAAFGSRATKMPPGMRARATRSNESSTSALVRCSRTSVAVTGRTARLAHQAGHGSRLDGSGPSPWPGLGPLVPGGHQFPLRRIHPPASA